VLFLCIHYFQLGHGSDLDQTEPVEVLLGHWGPRGESEESNQSGTEQVIAIACAQNNSGVIVRGRKDKHQLYIWGEGASGQFPVPENAPPGSSQLTPSLFPKLVLVHTPEQRSDDPHPELACLSFGTKHVAVATKAGLVYTWGQNAFGQVSKEMHKIIICRPG
jgi:alpha-tubulin suppressor-like RCC1 family protein